MTKSPEEIEQLRKQNNPNNASTGHYTGRCGNCGSNDLWDDCSVYGCNCCGAMFDVGDMMPLVIESK